MRDDIKEKIEKIKRREVPNGYVKTDVGIIPSEWKVKKIKDAVVIRNDLRTPISEQDRDMMEGEFPYYGPTQVQDYIDCYTIEGPSVLIGEDGDHFLKYKDKEMTMHVDGKYSVNNHAHVIQYKSGCDIKWFMYVFQHRNLFNSITRQGAGRYKLTKDALSKLHMQIASEKEQQKVISILESFDKLISLLNTDITKKHNKKNWLMQNLLTGKIRFSEFGGEWEKKYIKNVVKEGSKVRVTDTSAYRRITIKLNCGGIEFMNTSREMADSRPFYVRTLGEIIIGKQNYFNGSIALVDEKYSGAICSNAIMSFKVQEKYCDKYFLLYYLSQNDFIRRKSFFANGTGQKELSEKDFLDFDIIIPKLEEQRKIAKVLKLADKEIELLEKKLEQTKLEKKVIMQLLLSGIVRVN